VRGAGPQPERKMARANAVAAIRRMAYLIASGAAHSPQTRLQTAQPEAL
jgi:hypothetical protein